MSRAGRQGGQQTPRVRNPVCDCGHEFTPTGHPTRPVSVECSKCGATGTINHNRFGRITGSHGAVEVTEGRR